MKFGKRSLGDPERLAELIRLTERLPEVNISGDQHLAFKVRKKTFAFYLDDHHGDGVVSIACKSTLEIQRDLIRRHKGRYFGPPYMTHQGWVGLRIDLDKVHWDEVADLLAAAYKMQAPKRLAAQVE